MTEVRPDGRGDAQPELPLEELYDEMTLRRLGLAPELAAAARRTEPVVPAAIGPVAPEAVRPFDPADAVEGDSVEPDEERPSPRRHRSGRAGVAGALLAGAMLGLGDVLEPEKTNDAIIEPELLGEAATDQPVQFIMVPGLPKASMVILRPWLRAG